MNNVGFHGKPLIFFYFCDLDLIDYLFEFWVVFTKMVAEKIQALVVFIEGKKKLKPPGAQAEPSSLRIGLRPKRRLEGPA